MSSKDKSKKEWDKKHGHFVKKMDTQEVENIKFAKTTLSDTTAINLDDLEKFNSRQWRQIIEDDKSTVDIKKVNIDNLDNKPSTRFTIDIVMDKVNSDNRMGLKTDTRMFDKLSIEEIRYRLENENKKENIKILKKIIKYKKANKES